MTLTRLSGTEEKIQNLTSLLSDWRFRVSATNSFIRIFSNDRSGVGVRAISSLSSTTSLVLLDVTLLSFLRSEKKDTCDTHFIVVHKNEFHVYHLDQMSHDFFFFRCASINRSRSPRVEIIREGTNNCVPVKLASLVLTSTEQCGSNPIRALSSHKKYNTHARPCINERIITS